MMRSSCMCTVSQKRKLEHRLHFYCQIVTEKKKTKIAIRGEITYFSVYLFFLLYIIIIL